jgi:hypothetical protein
MIVPDKHFLTQKTRDLEVIQKALPKKTFYTKGIEFQKDFEDILNEKVDYCNTNDKFTCNQCKFKARSARCLNSHKIFVHSMFSSNVTEDPKQSLQGKNTCGESTKCENSVFVHSISPLVWELKCSDYSRKKLLLIAGARVLDTH